MLALLLLMSAGATAADFSAGQTEAAPPTPSSQRLICRSRPTLGSRITRTRVCKTAEEWRIYDNDMEQNRRDIADRGARGCGGAGPECR